MRRWLPAAVGVMITTFGLVIMLFPFVSSWRVSGQVLEQLPELDGVAFSDSRHRFGALFDDEFILATRSYQGVDADQVVDALLANGFEPTSVRSRPWFTKDCCGEYDAVWVGVDRSAEGAGGPVVATLSAADADIQSVYPLFVIFGLFMALPGLAVGLFRLGSAVGRRGGGQGLADRPDSREHVS